MMVKNSKKVIALIGLVAIMCTFNVVYAVSETVTIDLSSNLGTADHKGNGLLLGVTTSAPSDSIIAALKPSSWRICDKWDPIALSDRLMNIASSHGYTTQLQDILSDYIFYNYGNTEKSGPFNDTYYTSATNQYLANHQGHGLYAIDIFNEPDGWPYPQGALDTRAEKSNYWNICYRTIRANPNYNNVKIIGPSTSGQSVGIVGPYLDDAYTSGTYPDIISFHFPMHFPANNNPESTIQAIKDYCASKGYPSRPIQINEDVWSDAWTYPGTVARVFGYAERMGVKVNHACWQDGNNNNGDWFPMLDGLVDLNGNTRPCYWMYKAYADMTGSMLNVTRSVNYDASASKDTGSKKVVAILGSMNDVSGTLTAQFTNMSTVFSGTSVNVLVQKLAAGTNIVSGPATYSSGSVSISNNTVSVNVNVNSREGVIITLSNGSAGGVNEAENATLSGGATVMTDHTGYSGTGFVAGYYNTTTANTKFTVNVSTAGQYSLTLRYSAGNGTSTNTALYVNGTRIKALTCNATTNWDTWANQMETVTLQSGSNTIELRAETSATACINIDYITVAGQGSSPTPTPTRTPTATNGTTPSPTKTPTPTSTSSGAILFQTGLESGNTQPTWGDTVEVSTNVGGYLSGINPECSVRSGETTHADTASLMFSGTDNNSTTSFCYFKVFDVNIPITAATKLSYWFYPQMELSRGVAVDFVCTDGTTLRDSAAKDQNGIPMHPGNNRGTVNTWNQVQCSVGQWLNGKTIDRILVGYDYAPSTGQFRGYIDDIQISN